MDTFIFYPLNLYILSVTNTWCCVGNLLDNKSVILKTLKTSDEISIRFYKSYKICFYVISMTY